MNVESFITPSGLTWEEMEIKRQQELRDKPFDRMDPEWKEKWVEALRSGKYTQTNKALRDNKGMCCLGVLCDVVDTSRWRLDTTLSKIEDNPWAYFSEMLEDADGWNGDRLFESCEDSELPQDVRGLTGISLHSMSKCIDLNDAQSKTFTEIADIVEQEM